MDPSIKGGRGGGYLEPRYFYGPGVRCSGVAMHRTAYYSVATMAKKERPWPRSHSLVVFEKIFGALLVVGVCGGGLL